MHKEFSSHILSVPGGQKVRDVREAFDALLTRLDDVIPKPSREMSLARTKLEEACFFAVKAVASNIANQQ